MSDSSSRPKHLVRESIVVSSGPTSSTRIAIRVHDDSDDEAPTVRMEPQPPTKDGPVVSLAKRPGSERPTLRSATPPPTAPRSADAAPSSGQLFPTEVAAPRLHMSPRALRCRFRRMAKRTGNDRIADLGGGVVGVKVGATWRVRLPKLAR